MKNVAAYYAALEPQPVNVSKPLSPDEWAQKCDRCHGVNGNSVQANIPALAAQRVDYLETVLHDYQTRVVPNHAITLSSSLVASTSNNSANSLRNSPVFIRCVAFAPSGAVIALASAIQTSAGR